MEMEKQEGTTETKGKTVIQYRLEMTEDHLPSLVKEEAYTAETDVFMNPKDIDGFCRNVLRLNLQCEEQVYLMGLNVKGRIQGLFEVSHGTMSMAPCGMQPVACRLLLSGSSGAILIHNHPSGNTEPSMEDERLAERIEEVADILGIRLLDFLIIGDDYFSFCEHGLLRNGSRG